MQRQVLLPPRFQRLQKRARALRHAGIALDQVGEGAAVGDVGREVGVALVSFGRGTKAALSQAGVVLPEVGEGVDLRYRARRRADGRARRAARAAGRCRRSGGCCS